MTLKASLMSSLGSEMESPPASVRACSQVSWKSVGLHKALTALTEEWSSAVEVGEGDVDLREERPTATAATMAMRRMEELAMMVSFLRLWRAAESGTAPCSMADNGCGLGFG